MGRFTVASGETTPRADTCRWRERQPPTRDSLRVLDRTRDFPCEVVASLVVQLAPSPTGSRPDPTWFSIVQDSRGRIYSNAIGAPAVLMWDSAGNFVRTLGRAGEGPGELSSMGSNTLYIGPADELWVQQAFRWDIFDAASRYVRRIVGPAVTRGPGTRQVTSAGAIVSYGRPAGVADSSAALHVLGSDGARQYSFGDLEEHAVGRTGSAESGFPLGLSIDNTLWTARLISEDGDGYVLEEWSVAGARLRAFRRRAPWFTPEPEDDPLLPGFGLMPPIWSVHVDRRGLIWVALGVRDPRWHPTEVDPTSLSPDDLRTLDLDRSTLYDLRYDVVDPGLGAVVASGLIDDVSSRDIPVRRFVPRSNRSWRGRPDEMDLETIDIFELILIDGREAPGLP